MARLDDSRKSRVVRYPPKLASLFALAQKIITARRMSEYAKFARIGKSTSRAKKKTENRRLREEMKWKKSGNKKNAKSKKNEGETMKKKKKKKTAMKKKQKKATMVGKQEVGEGICSSRANYVNENGERIASVQ